MHLVSIRTHKVEQLVIAIVVFFWCFLMWFATAAFTPSIIDKFDLSSGQMGWLASSAIWSAPILRPLAGYMADRLGAPVSFVMVLVFTGGMSILSSYMEDYLSLFVTRALVSVAGISFVIGIQHVAQWFEAEEMGTAEGLYAGTGNAGAGVGMLLLPRIYETDYSTAFLHMGVVALFLAVLVILRGVPAKSIEQAEAAKSTATFRSTVFVWTRYAAIALMFAYAMSFGLEICLNAWISGYYAKGFAVKMKELGFTDVKSVQIAAGTFGAVQSFNAALFRPFAGYISDMWQRRGFMPFPILSKTLPYSPRLHWLMFSCILITAMMILLSWAGANGNIALSVVFLALLGIAISFGTGGTFAIVPLMFRERPGTATGFIGGVACLGGVIYPIVFAFSSNLHVGYAYVAVFIFIPLILFFFWALHWEVHPENHGIGSKDTWLKKK